MNGVINLFLPKNMTDLLQVLDLVVNAIFKQYTRKIRTEAIIKAFRIHKARLAADENNLGPFKCPKPTVKEAIDNYFVIIKQMEENQTLKESIIRSFKDTGCVPNYPDVNNTYKQYSDTTQYSSRGMAVTPERSSPIERIEEFVDILEDGDDPDDIIVDDNIDVEIEAIIAEAMIEPLDYDVSMNTYIDEVDESEDDTDSDDEDDFEFREDDDDDDEG